MANQAQILDVTLVLPTATPASANELAFDASGRLVYYNGSRTVSLPDIIEEQTFTQLGVLQTGTGTVKWYIETDCSFESIRIACGTSPAGASIICDVNKNGSTIYTTQANRPTIAAAGTNQLASTPDVTSFSAGDYITVDVDQVGSTTIGTDLTLTVRLRRV